MGSLSLDISGKEAYGEAFNQLLTCPVADIPSNDIALVNLLCAHGLPGSEDMDIPAYLVQLNHLVEFCIKELEKFVWNPAVRFSKAYHRMVSLITVLKRDYGAHYSIEQSRELDSGEIKPRTNSKDIFINGLLSSAKSGTCSSLPVLVAAVARKLGHPVYIIKTGLHVLNRWETLQEKFNIEPSGLAGMSSEPDELYRMNDKRYVRKCFPGSVGEGYLDQLQLDSGYWFKPLNPVCELTLFLNLRIDCLWANNRFDEALPLMARCLQLEPYNPVRPFNFVQLLGLAMRARYKILHPDNPLPGPKNGTNMPLELLQTTLSQSEIPFSETIIGHYHERKENFLEARYHLTLALKHSNYHPFYKANLDRFIKKRLLRDGGRKITFTPKPSLKTEVKLLRQVASQYEATNILVSARDAWAEAFMLDGLDVHAYKQYRRIEAMPEYQKQLKELESLKRDDWILKNHQPMTYSSFDPLHTINAPRAEWGWPSFAGIPVQSRNSE